MRPSASSLDYFWPTTTEAGPTWSWLYEMAIEDLGESIRLEPQYAGAYVNRGASYGYLGFYQRSIEDFDEATPLEPQLSPVYASRAMSYTSLGKDVEAEQDVARRLNPGRGLGVAVDLQRQDRPGD